MSSAAWSLVPPWEYLIAASLTISAPHSTQFGCVGQPRPTFLGYSDSGTLWSGEGQLRQAWGFLPPPSPCACCSPSPGAAYPRLPPQLLGGPFQKPKDGPSSYPPSQLSTSLLSFPPSLGSSELAFHKKEQEGKFFRKLLLGKQTNSENEKLETTWISIHRGLVNKVK